MINRINRAKAGLASIAMAFLLFCNFNSYGQETTAAITGTIKDQSGAVVPGAQVTATNVATASTTSSTSDQNGDYLLSNRTPGQYQVSVIKQGFSLQIRTGIVLVIGQKAVLNFVLAVGEIAQRVEVTAADVPLVNTTTSDLGSVVGSSEIRELPLNARSYVSLAADEPGVVQYSTAVSAGATAAKAHQGAILATNGLVLTGSIGYFIDGQSVTGQATVGAPATAAGDIPGIEAIDEFKIQRNSFSAAGGGSDTIISYVTRGGTNSLHGNLYEFFRNNVLDARNFFDPVSGVPPFRRNQFGGTLGGPIVKNKSFWFVNYEGYRQRLTTTSIATVPTNAARQGNLPSGTVQVDPAIVPYLNMFPVQNGEDFGDGTAAASFPNLQPVNQQFFLGRFDHSFSKKDAFMARYSIIDANASNALSLPLFKSVLGNRYQWVVLKETHTFSEHLLDDASFGYARSRTDINYASTQPIDSSLDFVPERGQFGTISFGPGGGYESSFFAPLSAIGGDSSAPTLIRENDFNWQDHLTYLRGKQAFNVGFSIQRFQTNEPIISGGNNGIYTFLTLSDFLQNQPYLYQVVPLWSDISRRYRMTAYAWYVQDDLKISPRLVLNIGLRHEFTSQPTEVNGKWANIVPITSDQITVGQLPSNSPFQLPSTLHYKVGNFFGPTNPTLKQFGPRVGFAYDLFGNGKTSIRGGFGIFYPLFTPAQMQYWGNLNPPWATIALFSGAMPFPHYNAANNATSGALLPAGFEMESGTPTTMQWHLTAEQQAGSFVFRIGYEGSHSDHLGRGLSNLGPTPTVNSNGQLYFNPSAPLTIPFYPPGSLVYSAAHDANGGYNALHVGIEKRFSVGLQFQADFVWSRAIYDFETEFSQEFAASTGGDSLSQFNRHLDYGLSPYNVNHRLTYNFVYELPVGHGRRFYSNVKGAADKVLSGWTVDGLGTVQSGLPFTVLDGFDYSGDGNYAFPSDRPSVAPGYTNNPILGGPNQYFDTSAFVLPAPGTYGNLGRDTLIGPSLIELDSALIKETQISERVRMQFRAEFFNFPNHANFGLPANQLFSPTGTVNGNAGKIFTTTTTSRQIQFGLKLFF